MSADEAKASPFEARLPDFIEYLRSSGIELTVDQQTRFISFVADLVACGKLPPDGAQLASLITPLLATSPLQQTKARQLMLEFCVQSRSRRFDSAKVSENEKEERFSWRIQFSLARLLVGSALIMLAIATLLVAFLLIPEGQEKLRLPQNNDYTYSSQHLDVHDDWLLNYPIEELELPEQSPWNRTLRWFYTEYTPIKWTAALFPWILYGGALYWLYTLLIAFLRREAFRLNSPMLDLRLLKPTLRFGDRRLLANLQLLRHIPNEYKMVLNPHETAKESASAGGLLRPRYDRVAIPKDFIVLMDRRSQRDHLAAYNMEIIGVMRTSGLLIDIFFFDRDASLVQSERTQKTIKLEELISCFPQSVFLIFADGEQLISRADGALLPWAQSIKVIEAVAFITSKLDGERCPVEFDLCVKHAFHFFPATPLGIVHLGRYLRRIKHSYLGTQNKFFCAGAASGHLAAFLSERPQRWLQRVEPMGGTSIG